MGHWEQPAAAPPLPPIATFMWWLGGPAPITLLLSLKPFPLLHPSHNFHPQDWRLMLFLLGPFFCVCLADEGTKMPGNERFPTLACILLQHLRDNDFAKGRHNNNNLEREASFDKLAMNKDLPIQLTFMP